MEHKEKVPKQGTKFILDKKYPKKISSSSSKLKNADIAPENPAEKGTVPDVPHSVMKKCNNNSSHSNNRKNEDKSDFQKTRSSGELFTRNAKRKCQAERPNDLPNHSPLTRNIKPTSVLQLSSLTKNSSNDILLAILDKKPDVLSLLNEINIAEDIFAYLLTVLGKACSSDLHTHMNDFMTTVWCKNKYFLIHIQRYLGTLLKREGLEQYHVDSTFYFVVFLEKFQHTMPSSSSDSLSILLPLLRDVTERCLKPHEKLYCKVSEKLKEIDDENQSFLKHYSLHELEKEAKQQKLCMQEPPENFRCLPVLPTMYDINFPCMFLRPNIVKGKYINAEHYLDVQFRLLREDYIMPLRDGVAEYLNHKKYGKSFKSCKNVRVYRNSHIVGEDFVDGELLHLLHFPDKNFSKIKWERSKRLMTGSLLCLSSDDFQSMLLATVAVRDPERLKNGLMYIHFEYIAEATMMFKQATNFVILETTSAYFEAYCHNMKALHQLNEEMLPFKSYIIDVEKTIQQPEYLTTTTAYDMRPLLIPLNKRNIIESKTGEFMKYDYPDDIANIAQSVSVLNEDVWPSASELNLDKSQYVALKTAATKELAIIQGPPGTGKTFIGLRIAQLFLHNINKWFSDQENSLPILVVCYTNHALDQFLEGLLLFTQKIVRIGERGSNMAMSQYKLKNLKRSHRWKIPRYISDAKRKRTEELDNLKKEIYNVKICIENSSKTVLHEQELSEYIPDFHYKSLKMNYSRQPLAQHSKLTIYDWLNICSTTAEYMKKLRLKKSNKFVVTRSFDPSWEINKEFENEDEAVIEYIENERDIDYYNFDDNLFSRSLKTYDESIEDDDSLWHNRNNKYTKEMIKYIEKWLRSSEIMNESDALKVKNVWNLDYIGRWKLYKFWLQKFIKDKKNKLSDLQEKLKAISEEVRQLRIEEDLHLLRDSHIVGMTTTGAAKFSSIVQSLNPAILIVEEAAEILESHIITSLTPKTKHMILIGDHQQLRPSNAVYMLSVKYNMGISLFERMIKNGIGYCTLSIQHRMRPEISALIVPHIYPNLENHPDVMDFEDIKGVEKNVFFVTHNFSEIKGNDSKSKSNVHEATFLIQLCKYLLLQGHQPTEITVLTTYSDQLFILKKLATDEMEKVRFTVVDNFQGEENTIILISFVRSNDAEEIGFLKIPNRVCVALSRAKKGLYCIGNFELLAKKSHLWKNILDTLDKRGSIGKCLPLICQNHPDTCNKVSTAADFQAVSNGGCSRKCDYRLSCGHCCPLTCHPYDHKSILCTKPCIKSCKEGHPCKRLCYESCGLCQVPVDKTLERCGHTMTVPCCMEESEIFCTFKYEKVLDCTHRCISTCGSPCVKECHEPCLKTCEKGHPCKKKCSDLCGSCDEQVERKLSLCGHIVTAPCGMNEDKIKCTSECEKILQCTHKCVNKCGDICVDSCKVSCIKTCDKGHPCQTPCFKKCNFCTFLVEKTLKRCGHKVKEFCWKSDGEILCSFKCKEILPCSHNCTNKCGEPCVEICRQMKEVTSPICGHLLNVECHLSDNSGALFKKCSEEMFQMCLEPCKVVLPCGHTCKGTCGSCHQGRLHVACNEICNRILVCGHKCNSNCYRSCPPCSEPCENSCVHKKCLRKCGEPCIKCTESCEWSCKHKQCTRLCNEICNREGCDESCPLVLPCGHPCLGFCGEPCPNKCNICEKNSAPAESKYEDCVRYILLLDCHHAIKLQDLNNQMAVKSNPENVLQLKTCPQCNTIIRKNFRYGYVIKTSLFLLEIVKKKYYSREQEIRIKFQKFLYRKIRYSVSHSKPLCKSLSNAVSHKRNRSIQELANIENTYNIVSDIESLKISKRLSDFISKSPFLQSLFDFERITCLWLANFIQKNCFRMSDSQFLQMTFETLRLKLINKLLKYAETLQMESRCPSFEVCAQHLLNYSSFDRKNVKAFISAFQTLTHEYGGSDSDKSLNVDFPILRGMNMSLDSWKQCTNGHIFCIMVPFTPYQKSCHLCIENTSDKMSSESQSAHLKKIIRKQKHETSSVPQHSENSVLSEALEKRSATVGKNETRRKWETSWGIASRGRKYDFKF